MRMGCTLNLKTVRRPLRLQTVEKVICVQDQKGNLPAKMSRCWKHPVYTHLCDCSNLRPTAHSTVKKLAQRLKRRKMPSSGRTFMKLELLKWETEWPPKLLKNEMHRMSLLLHGQRASLTWWQQKLCITISVMQDTFFSGRITNEQARGRPGDAGKQSAFDTYLVLWAQSTTEDYIRAKHLTALCLPFWEWWMWIFSCRAGRANGWGRQTYIQQETLLREKKSSCNISRQYHENRITW